MEFYILFRWQWDGEKSVGRRSRRVKMGNSKMVKCAEGWNERKMKPGGWEEERGKLPAPFVAFSIRELFLFSLLFVFIFNYIFSRKHFLPLSSFVLGSVIFIATHAERAPLERSWKKRKAREMRFLFMAKRLMITDSASEEGLLLLLMLLQRSSRNPEEISSYESFL